MFGQIWNSGWTAAMRSPQFKRWAVRRWYDYFSMLDRDGNVKVMNNGYDGGARIPLQPYEESNRYALQMYHHVAGQVALRDLNVLEVGSGRGGGAAFVMRTMRPRTYIGVDIAGRNIAFSRQNYRAPGLHFKQGNAENLEFKDARFDAVISIESALYYGNMERVLSEVHRVLKPGGYFLYAEKWRPGETDALYAELKRAGLELLSVQDMTPEVLSAVQGDNARREGLIRTYTPEFLHSALAEFAGTQGSTKYDDLAKGRVRYLCMLLQKAPTPPAPEKCDPPMVQEDQYIRAALDLAELERA